MIRVTLQLCDIIQGIPQAMLGDLHIVTRTESDACVSSPKSWSGEHTLCFTTTNQFQNSPKPNGEMRGLQIQCANHQIHDSSCEAVAVIMVRRHERANVHGS
jgi:hypothetical protein